MIDRDKLATFRIFEGLNRDELEVILGFSRKTEHKSGEILLGESEIGTDSDLFVIVKGMVKIEVRSPKLQVDAEVNKRLAVLKGGDVFGEIGLLGANRRSAKVSAYADIEILTIDRKKLFELFTVNNHIGYVMMRNLASILSDRLVELNFMWRDDI